MDIFLIFDRMGQYFTFYTIFGHFLMFLEVMHSVAYTMRMNQCCGREVSFLLKGAESFELSKYNAQ